MYSVKWIESFDVMESDIVEYEKKLFGDNEIILDKSTKETLIHQIEKLKSKKSELKGQVDTGILTELKYSSKIKSCMKRDMKLRKKLLLLNRSSEAKLIGLRVLVMKKEVFGDGPIDPTSGTGGNNINNNNNNNSSSETKQGNNKGNTGNKKRKSSSNSGGGISGISNNRGPKIKNDGNTNTNTNTKGISNNSNVDTKGGPTRFQM